MTELERRLQIANQALKSIAEHGSDRLVGDAGCDGECALEMQLQAKNALRLIRGR